MTTSSRLNQMPLREGENTRHSSPQEHIPRARQEEQSTPAYYDVPMLKPPVWKWEITTYFYLGGLSGGAFALARMADRFGRGRYPEVTRFGTAIAFSAFLPCAPLLIRDLGDPKRFHYMLRVFKPKSPMNLGAWTLGAFGGVLTLAALNEWRKSRQHGEASRIGNAIGEVIGTVADVAGVPLGLLLAGYTGVLLSTASTPLWARNPWIGPLFSAGALSTGAEAISLAQALRSGRLKRRDTKPVQQVGTAAKLAEAVALGGFLASAGTLAEPVTKGKYSPHLWAGAVGTGLVLSTALEKLPVKSDKTRRWLQIGGAVAGLIGGFALRWAISQGGHPSGNDPEAARKASRPR